MAEVMEHADLLEEWVNELRSGDKYKNGVTAKNKEYSFLRYPNGDGVILYNPCGVLLDLYDSSMWRNVGHCYSWSNWHRYIEQPLINKLGLTDSIYRNYLASRRTMVSFKEVADYIEEHILLEVCYG